MKKLLIFLMISIPLLIILIVNFTIDVVIGDVYIAVERIELDKSSIIANVDEKINIKATVYPQNATNKDLIWSSDNEDVAIVDENGNVSFVGFGNGYITVTSADGNKIANCYFYVTDTKVHQVLLYAPSNEMKVGATMQLSTTILPAEAINKNVTYTSSNNEIAKVDSNGMVYALKSGSVTITVTSEDGGLVDSVNISITIPVSGLEVLESEAVISKTYYQIAYSIYPSDATNKMVKFEIDDLSIATVDNLGLVTFKKAGTVKVTVTSEDGNFSKEIYITSTDGYAYDLNLTSTNFNIEVGQSVIVDYTVLPNDIYNTSVSIISENENVVVIDNNGYIRGVGGGNAIVNVSVEKAPGKMIVKQIYVYVSSPATSIIIDDIITAGKNITLNPKSYPQDSTNVNYFYHSDNPDVAIVNEIGQVTLITDEPRKVSILIYANEDYSEVYKRVYIQYTANMASSFDLLDENIVLNYGDTVSLNYSIEPANVTNKNINIELLSSSCENEVIQIQSDGTILAVGGGNCTIKVSMVLYDGSVCEEYRDITVIRPATQVVIDLDLEMLEGQYVTALNTVSLNATVLPKDATNQNVNWTVSDKNIGIIANNTLIFNKAGEIILYANVDDAVSQVIIQYTGSYPLSAQIGILDGENIIDLPTMFYVGESFDIVLKSVFPTNANNTNISLQVTNQLTLNATGQVLQLIDNKVTAVNGGSATLIVYVGATIQLSYQIEVIRSPQSIVVEPANTKVTSSKVDLNISILPIDTTDKSIVIEIDNPEIAEVKENSLIFKQNGLVTVTITCLADTDIFTQFTIEKIEKEAVILSIEDESTNLVVNDLAYFDMSEINEEYDSYNIEILQQNPDNEQTEVVTKQNDMIKVLGLGSALIELQIFKNNEIISNYQHILYIVQFIEDIKFVSDIDFYNDEFVTAKEVLDLKFEIYPSNSTNKNVDYEITQSFSSNGISESIGYINNGKIYFIKEGYIILTVTSQDGGGLKKDFRIRYTGGDALSADINLTSPVYLNEGESITIEVTNWIPKDVVNNVILIKEITHTANVQVIKIDGTTITAMNGGISRLLIELSNGITKDITINVIKMVTSIQIDQSNILTIDNKVTINASALPISATNRTLNYEIEENDFAYIDGNTIVFNKPGTVKVTISSTDGGKITKEVIVTSTMGYVNSLKLNAESKSINKGETFKIYVLSYLPSNALFTDFYFEIIEQKPNDSSISKVADIDQNGIFTAYYGGNAIVRVYTYDYYGNKVYADCVITVIAPVENIEITFETSLDLYQNSYVTTQKSVTFKEIIFPVDASIRTLNYQISDSKIAHIEDNKIIFDQKGKVTIKFISDDSSRGEKSQTITFMYTGGDLLVVDIDRSQMVNNKIYLNAGDEFIFEVLSFIPSDCADFIFTYSNISENRIDENKVIGEFFDNKFISYNGGTITFNVLINSVDIGVFTIEVYRDASYIEFKDGNSIIVGVPSYTINAIAMPSDTYQTKLSYSIDNNLVASVSDYGIVEFYTYGTVKIKVFITDNPEIFNEITITYTKDIQGISFSETKTEMYTGEYVDFELIPNPIDADEYELELSLSNEEIADLIKNGNGWRLIGKSGGDVIVYVKVKGTNISVSKTFTFYTKITDIQLELDKVGDNVGLGQYRYFASSFIDDKGDISDSFQMKYNLTPGNEYSNLLTWSSSDESIAKVDQNGIVTVLNTGTVRITVKQIAPYQGATVASDYYDFTFVEGVNVYNYQQFISISNYYKSANEKLTNNYPAIVLQDNIISDKTIFNSTIYLNYNLYGNGYMLDLSELEAYIRISVRKSNIIIDNITIRGNTLKESDSLKSLDGKGILLLVENHSQNLLIYNSIIENADTCMKILSAGAIVKGCIFRNAFLACIKLLRNTNDNQVATLTVEDSAFANSLLAGILFDIDYSSDVGQKQCVLNLVGDVYFYCWKTIDEIEEGMKSNLEQLSSSVGIASGVLDELVKQFKNIVLNYNDYKYTYNGKDYFNFAVLNYDIKVLGLKFNSGNGIINRSQLNGNCNYTTLNIQGTITAGIANADFVIPAMVLPGAYPFIRPGDTYEGNQYVLALLRQPKLI